MDPMTGWRLIVIGAATFLALRLAWTLRAWRDEVFQGLDGDLTDDVLE